jgi:DNA polymerase-3 subunit gamma/tau
MSQTALYRKWRPQSFSTIVGQKAIVTTLRNAVKEQRTAHAYIFSGPRGTGKTSTARILAKAINCVNLMDGEPCNQCLPCMHITQGSELDVIEIDAASQTGVDNIRELTEQLNFVPVDVRKKVVIIDEVHMLSGASFNALLKTLEEPPEHVLFILATTEMHKIIPTVVSRCQRFEFKRISLEEQVEHLRYICRQESIEMADDAVQYLARLSDGGMRDALSLLDQTIAFAGRTITMDDLIEVTGGLPANQYLRFFQAYLTRDIAQMIQFVQEWVAAGKNAAQILHNCIEFFRDVLIFKLIPDSKNITFAFSGIEWQTQLQSLTVDDLYRAIKTLSDFVLEIKYAAHPQTVLELAFIKLCADSGETVRSENPSTDVQMLTQKIHQLETQLHQLSNQLQTYQGQIKASGSKPPSKSSLHERATISTTRSLTDSQIQNLSAARNSQMTKKYQLDWPKVMARVKEASVSLHAWLKEGQPVAFVEDAVLLVFNTPIHCETTNKPDNKSFFEQRIAEVYGHPLKIVAIQQFEWKKITDEPTEAETLKMESETIHTESQPPWIEEAIQLFGEQLVEIKTTTKGDTKNE